MQEFLKVILNKLMIFNSEAKNSINFVIKMNFLNFEKEEKFIEITLRTGHFFGEKCLMFVFQDQTIQQRIFEVEHRDKTR